MPLQNITADLKLLGLPSSASLPQIQQRYQQLVAALSCNSDSSPKLIQLCSTTREKLHSAYSNILAAQPQQSHPTPPTPTAPKIKLVNFIWIPVALVVLIAIFSHHPSPEPEDSTNTGTQTSTNTGTETGTDTGTTTGASTGATNPPEPPKPNPADELLSQRATLIEQRQKYWDANRATQAKIIALDNKVNDLNYQIGHLGQVTNLDFEQNWDYANQVNPQACEQYLDLKQQVKQAERERESIYPIDRENSNNYVQTNEQITQLDDKLRAMGVTPPS